MLATWLFQTNPSTQADLKFKAYLDWEHLLKKMSFALRIMACKSSSIIFHLIGFVFYRAYSKEEIWKFWPGIYTQTRWPTGTELVFVGGYAEWKRQVFLRQQWISQMVCVKCLNVEDKGFRLHYPQYKRGINGANWAAISDLSRTVIWNCERYKRNWMEFGSSKLLQSLHWKHIHILSTYKDPFEGATVRSQLG